MKKHSGFEKFSETIDYIQEHGIKNIWNSVVAGYTSSKESLESLLKQVNLSKAMRKVEIKDKKSFTNDTMARINKTAKKKKSFGRRIIPGVAITIFVIFILFHFVDIKISNLGDLFFKQKNNVYKIECSFAEFQFALDLLDLDFYDFGLKYSSDDLNVSLDEFKIIKLNEHQLKFAVSYRLVDIYLEKLGDLFWESRDLLYGLEGKLLTSTWTNNFFTYENNLILASVEVSASVHQKNELAYFNIKFK